MVRINFQPYTTSQLEMIVHARLEKSREGLPAKAPDVISKDGVKFASMKVSSISGDARRVLDICRCVPNSRSTLSQAIKCSSPFPGQEDSGARSTENEDSRDERRQGSHFGHAEFSHRWVSPRSQSSRENNVSRRPQMRQERGGGRSKMGRREQLYFRVIEPWPHANSFSVLQVQHQHIIYTSILTGDNDPTRKPTFSELNGVLDSLSASRAMLIEDGAAAQRKPADERKVMLNLEQIEVERVLSEIGGQMWKNALGVS